MELLKDKNNIHIIGAGGIGLSAVAKLLIHQGKKITGSDAEANESTDELKSLGAEIIIGQKAENVPVETEAVIFSDAVPEDNPERTEAKNRRLAEFSYFDFLGQLSRGYRTVAVSGTNGKSTTTALLGLMLAEAGLDPTVIIGSRFSSFEDRNLRLGHGNLLVVEACEYRANMLKLAPQTIVLTNIEADHLDFYRDLGHIQDTFQAYLDSLPQDGRAIVNSDDLVIGRLSLPETTITYGLENPADYQAINLRVEEGVQSFDLIRRGQENLGHFVIRIPGRYNVMNALAALATALELGAEVDGLRRSLAHFSGIWRRFELLGEFNEAIIVSDYGHTPTAIKETIAGAKKFFPGRKVFLCFQPHHRNRTKMLFDDFVAALKKADKLALVEVYDVAGREESDDVDVSSKDLIKALDSKKTAYFSDPKEAEKGLRQAIEPGDVVIIMGAGNIYRVAENLTTKSQFRL